jgi:hypothetical protein
MTDRGIIERVSKLFNCTLCGPYVSKQKKADGSSKKETWFAHLSGNKAAAWMMTIYPLMGLRRQEKIKELLTRWRTY